MRFDSMPGTISFCDPVLVSTSGTPLLDRDGLEALVSALPLFTLLSPNVPEVVAMAGKSVATECDLVEAGHALMALAPVRFF
jgi:hydroxymethylpyrimidine/phosphomethylpyrimidine kinase